MEGQEECKFTGRQCFGWNSTISWCTKSTKTTPESAANTQGKLNKREEVLQDRDFTIIRNLSLSWHIVLNCPDTTSTRLFSSLSQLYVSEWSYCFIALKSFSNNFEKQLHSGCCNVFYWFVLTLSLSCNSFRNESNLSLLWHLVALANSTSTKHPDPYPLS